VEILWLSDPFEVVAEFLEGIGEALDVARAIVEEVEAHVREMRWSHRGRRQK
jgi:hypothetical protein